MPDYDKLVATPRSPRSPLQFTATGWVIVVPTYNTYGKRIGFKLQRIVKSRPQMLANGERAFKLSVTLPEEVFDPFADVSITVPASEVIEPLVQVGE